MLVARLKEMFEQMVLKKDASALPSFYAPTFELYSNGIRQGYEEFAAGHERVYASEISYRVEYDEAAWVEAVDRVAGRLWITTGIQGEKQTRMEIILIAQFEGERMVRLWETTSPDWRNLDEMSDYAPD